MADAVADHRWFWGISVRCFFLMNGYQLRGQVAGFDAFVVFLITDGKQQMIYKHAISTITPERPVDMSQGE